MPDVPPRLRRKLLEWVVCSKELIAELEQSGLVVTTPELPAPDVVERSQLLAGASLELTHAMLVLVGVLAPGRLREGDAAVASARRGQHPGEVRRGQV